MRATDFTDKYTNDKEERLLLRKLSDLLDRSGRDYSVVYSAFLNPAQISLAAGVTEFCGKLDFVGGYEGAERCLARLSATEYCEDTDPPIVLITARASDKTAVISHRDVLGALMGLGIKREMLGELNVFCVFHSICRFVSFTVAKVLQKPSRSKYYKYLLWY